MKTETTVEELKGAARGWAAIVLIALACGGCATSAMKSSPFYSGSERVYTGKVEDRVNLWPLAYWREPMLSVLWPVFSKTDDHLAIRPLYSQERTQGAGSPYDAYNLLWPLCRFDTRRGKNRIFPVFWGRGYFNVFPFLWNDGDFHSLFPLVFWKERQYLNVFPFCWFDFRDDHYLLFPLFYHDDETTAVFPVYGRKKNSDVTMHWIGPGLAGWETGEKADCSWLFPLWYRDAESFVSLPWCSGRGGDGESWWCVPPLLSHGERNAEGSSDSYLFGLAGRTREKSGYRSSWAFPFYYENSEGVFATPLYGRNRDSSWLFPVWYRDERLFASWFWAQRKGEDDRVSWWAIPPLLTEGERGEKERSFRSLLGLVGAEWTADDSSWRTWAAPFFLADRDDGFVTPLGGSWKGADWLLPLFYRDEKRLVTPLFYRDEDTVVSPLWARSQEGDETWDFYPPLLSWSKRGQEQHRLDVGLLGLFARETNLQGETEFAWAFPFFTYQRSEGWTALLWLLGHRGDSMWAFPFFTYERDGSWTALSWLIGSDRDSHWALPFYAYDRTTGDFGTLLFGRIGGSRWWFTPLVGTRSGTTSGFWLFPFLNHECDSSFAEMERLMSAPRLEKADTDTRYSRKKTTFLFGQGGSEREIVRNPWDGADAVEAMAGGEWRDAEILFRDRKTFGNRLLYGGFSERAVNFDSDTKEKLFDGTVSDACSLFGLVWKSRRESIPGRHEYVKKSLLWRFWHHEELNGDATTDCFPFITVDHRKDGYSKTSFLWRFFRYENDPQKGKAVDFLFIPVYRKASSVL